MKIRIFALAKELDIDSKLLIDYCSKAGITIKNSALASISPEERDRVMDIIRSSGGSTTATAVALSPNGPKREHPPEVVGKARPMRNMNEMQARPQPSRVQAVEPPSGRPAVGVLEEPEDEESSVAPEPDEAVAIEAFLPVAQADFESPVAEVEAEVAETAELPVERPAGIEPATTAPIPAADASKPAALTREGHGYPTVFNSARNV